MLEFKSQTRPQTRPIIPFLVVGVAVIAAAVVFLVVRRQGSPPRATQGPIVVEGVIRAGHPDFEYYRKYVKIESVKASLSTTFSKARVATISGLIVNDGDRKLEAVELKVGLYDVYGKPSKEKTTFALRPGLGIGYSPMEPLEKRIFAVSLENIEQLWNPRHVEYEVTGLRYR
jgi:hypothetical protein